MARKQRNENAAESGDAAGQTGAPAPKRTIDERVHVLRVADKINGLGADDKMDAVAALNAADADLASLAARHEVVADALTRAAKLSPNGLAMLRKLVS